MLSSKSRPSELKKFILIIGFIVFNLSKYCAYYKDSHTALRMCMST